MALIRLDVESIEDVELILDNGRRIFLSVPSDTRCARQPPTAGRARNSVRYRLDAGDIVRVVDNGKVVLTALTHSLRSTSLRSSH